MLAWRGLEAAYDQGLVCSQLLLLLLLLAAGHHSHDLCFGAVPSLDMSVFMNHLSHLLIHVYLLEYRRSS